MGRTIEAVKKGPHGKQKNADGTANSTPNPHGPTSGSDGLNGFANREESYRVGEHATSKELEAGEYDPREPKPKGTNPSDGTSTTRDDASRYRTGDPSAGGTVRAPKDSANCDDALGTPEEHHGTAEEAKVVSGRGPKAAQKQGGRNWLHGTLDADGKTTN